LRRETVKPGFHGPKSAGQKGGGRPKGMTPPGRLLPVESPVDAGVAHHGF
jgi:hypothetical protein